MTDRLEDSSGFDVSRSRCEGAADLDPLLERIGDARFVLLGEASHGTREFYTWRAEISRRLIEEKGFSFIAVEGDWPDCYRVNRYVKAYPGSGGSAQRGAARLRRAGPPGCGRTGRWWRWPSGCASTTARSPQERQAGFYGLDVYSLWESMDAVQEYLERVDPAAARRARARLRLLRPLRRRTCRSTPWPPRWSPPRARTRRWRCSRELRRQAPEYREDGREAYFNAEQNALTVRNAELYYRTMVRGGPAPGTCATRHMVETLDRLMEHHGPRGEGDRLGAQHPRRATRAPPTWRAPGWSTWASWCGRRAGARAWCWWASRPTEGSVIAGEEWGAPMERMPVPPAREGSWERILHERCGRGPPARLRRRGRPRRDAGAARPPRHRRGLQPRPRALGQLRADRAPLPLRRPPLPRPRRAPLHPLHMEPHEDGEPPETFPSGM